MFALQSRFLVLIQFSFLASSFVWLFSFAFEYHFYFPPPPVVVFFPLGDVLDKAVVGDVVLSPPGTWTLSQETLDRKIGGCRAAAGRFFDQVLVIPRHIIVTDVSSMSSP